MKGALLWVFNEQKLYSFIKISYVYINVYSFIKIFLLMVNKKLNINFLKLNAKEIWFKFKPDLNF